MTKREEIEELLAKGRTIREIARDTGYSSDSIKNVKYFKPKGGNKDKRLWTEEEQKQVRAMVVEGLGYSKIAKRMNRTRNSVCGLVFRMGLSKPTQTERKARVEVPREAPPHRSPAKLRLVVDNVSEVVPPNDPEARAIWNYFRAIDAHDLQKPKTARGRT
jgi:hypothetical protein